MTQDERTILLKLARAATKYLAALPTETVTIKHVRELLNATDEAWKLLESKTAAAVKAPAPKAEETAEGQAKSTEMELAFLQGIEWWEYRKNPYATMWQHDKANALNEARRRAEMGILGKE